MNELTNRNGGGPRNLRSKDVLEEIKHYIIENDLRAGDRIPTEHELAHDLKVSRVTVREATKALNLVGILDSSPRRGTVVGEIDIANMSDFIGLHFATSNYSKEELVAARLVIEVGHLELAMANMTEEDYPRLLKLADAPEAVHADRPRWLGADMVFHRALLEVGGNRPLRSIADLLHHFFHLAVRQRGRSRADVTHDHRMIVEALHAKNLDLAQGLMRQHLMRYLDPDEPAHREMHATAPPPTPSSRE